MILISMYCYSEQKRNVWTYSIDIIYCTNKTNWNATFSKQNKYLLYVDFIPDPLEYSSYKLLELSSTEYRFYETTVWWIEFQICFNCKKS